MNIEILDNVLILLIENWSGNDEIIILPLVTE